MKATHIKITAHPSNQSKIYRDEAVFTITAEGDGTLFYQWQKDGVDITITGHPYCTGSTTPTLHFTSVISECEGSYKCIFRNSRSTVTAVIGTLTLWKKHTVCVIAILLTIVIACACLLNFLYNAVSACRQVVTSIHCQILINVLEHPLFRNPGYATDSCSAALL